jgi:hypothetical protein
VPEKRQQADLRDPGEDLQAVGEHELGPAAVAAPFQGAAIVATARLHDHKDQKEVVGLDAPAEVTVGRLEVVVEFRENKDAEAARQSRGREEEGERIALQAAAGGEVADAPEE